ncbi:CHAT domain-containing protein [Aquimarina sp. 2201CG5-10]|uniref:CHAT domain-containing protein n=1 Tax=Aquimarina callyspongiae TaxID=3098150 RepID=UPI002AB4C4EA|nr:tetratricopeptide repeat protein [Aquimarina sp. 2201CG5-10]MDY8134981.1 tetratricopeptide repeat protein [Aquimarina sp. 2201CG5-10]
MKAFYIFLIIFLGLTNFGYSQTKTDTIIASQYLKKADSLLGEWKYDNSIELFKKALPIYEQAKAWERVASCYNKISENQWRNSKYEESLVSAKKALEISTQYLKKNNLEEANYYVNVGKYYEMFKSDFNSAFKFYQKAFITRSQILPKDHYLIADSYDRFSNLNIKKGNYKEALAYQKKALKIRIDTFGELHTLSAESYNSIGNIHFDKWEYDKALIYYKKALFIKNKNLHVYHPNLASSYGIIGLTYLKKEQNEIALKYLKKELAIKIKVLKKNHNDIAIGYNNIGVIYKLKGKYNQAFDYYQKSLKIKKNIFGENHIEVASSYHNISILYRATGKYNEALTFIQKAISIKENTYGKNNIQLVNSLHSMGLTHRQKGEYDKAIYYYKKSLAIKEVAYGKNHISIAYSYNNLGAAYRFQKKLDKALIYYHKALKIKQQKYNHNHTTIANSLTEIGRVLEEKENYNDAIVYYQKALTIRSTILSNNHPEVADTHNTIANTHIKKEQYNTALLYFSKAISSNLKNKKPLNFIIYLNTLKSQAKTYIALYQQHKNLHHLEQSIKIYQKADTLINSIRQTLNNYEDKVAFANTAKEVYKGAIEAQLLLYNYNKDQNTLPQAFYYTEKSKANTLKDLLNDANAKSFTGLPSDLLTLEKDLRIDHAYYQSHITKEYAKQQIDSSKVSNYESKLFDISRRQDSLTEILEKNYPKYYQLKYQNKVLSVADIQQKLGESTTLLEFFTTDSTTYAFTITKNKLAATKLKTPRLEDNIQSLRQTITAKNLDKYQEQAHSLYSTLINPIKDQLQGDRLIIIPDGPLWHLNFDLLLTHNNYNQSVTVTHPKEYPLLLKEYAISYVNATNLLFDAPDTTLDTKKRKECLAFSFSDSTKTSTANTISFATLRDSNTDLPGTRKEIKAISDIIDGQYYYGSEAIEANFKKNVSQYNILHLALHGEVDNERPENSKLFFTKNKDTIEDNLLYGHELFALDIPAELTVLSACNTGSGKIAKGEGIMSLGTAFQYAGTKSLLLTNWAVSDETTPQLMQYFYTNLKAGMSKDKALQQAKLQYLNTDKFHYLADPFYWGGFYLVGDTTPIQFSQDDTWYWVIGFVILGVLLLFLWYKRNNSPLEKVRVYKKRVTTSY